MFYFALVSASHGELKTKKKTMWETDINVQILLSGLIRLLWYSLGEFDQAKNLQHEAYRCFLALEQHSAVC